MKLNFDKSKLISLKFGDIAKKINSKIDPETYDSDVVIEGGHINNRDFHIRKHQDKKTMGYLGPAFNMGFKKNQILYVSRNPHLVKVGYPQFNGICSNTTFIIETLNENIFRNDLIPFLMHSDNFINQSIENVRGGVNPYVNWGDLANIDIKIPPDSNEQYELSKLLWALDGTLEKNLNLIKNLEIFYESELENAIHNINLNNKTISEVLDELSSKTDLISLSELGSFYKGKGIIKSELKEKGIPCIRYADLYTNHHIIIREIESFISEDDIIDKFKIQKNDLLIAGSGETIEEIGKSAVFVENYDAYAGGDVIIFRPTDMDGHYLGYLMNSKLVRYQLNKLGTGSTVMHIYKSDLEKIKVPFISKDSQVKISKKLESINKIIIKAQEKKINLKFLKESLINEIFS